MKNEIAIKVLGNQPFMNQEIPVVLGGFGPKAKCVCDKTIAEIHGQPEREIRKSINRNINRFREKVDVIDLKKGGDEITTSKLLADLGYTKQMITQAEHIYILSERGYAKLIKIMDTDLAWEIHDKLIDEYFMLREEKRQQTAKAFPLSSVNNAVQILDKTLAAAGVSATYRALTMQRLYRKAGVELELDFMKSEKQFYLKEAIAEKLGVMVRKSGAPHAMAIGAIIDQIAVADDEKTLTTFERNGHEDHVWQYAEAVVDRVNNWLSDNDYPADIPMKNGKNCHVAYKE